MTDDLAIEASGLAKSYRDVRVLDGVDLEIPRGRVLALLGPHGAAGMVVAVIGVVPLVAGVFDFCVFAPLFGMPLSGPRIRAGK